MNVKVSDSFKRLMSRVDCKIIISEAWLGETDQGFAPNKNSLIQIPANGIWKEEDNTLKVLVIIPDEHIIDNNDQRQEYGAIYFFSSTNSDEPAFILYDLDEPLSLGRNLINIKFPDIKARIKMVDTSEDTIFLETFGQNPGKNIYLTGNESSLVAKNTYYVFWRIETTDDDTFDLPILDENGKLITENYTYKTYSNLRISCPGLTRTSNPPAKFGLSDNGGVVPITGIADFVEYKVFGGTIKETISGEITIDNIPGSEIVYISGHNDLGQPVSEAFNIFTPNNYLSLIEYKQNDYPGSYGADGIFGLRVRYYDVKEQRPVVLDSVNQIKLVRRDVADNWFILDRSSRFIEETEEYGEVPVFMFPYDTNGSEYLIIRTKFLEPINDLSQITVTQENEVLNDLFNVDLSLSSFTDENGTYFVDIYVSLSALTTNNDPVNWAPIVDNVSTLLYTKISYEDYFTIFYLVQKPNIEGSLKLVDISGTKIDQIRMANTETSKFYYAICDAEESPNTDFDNRPAWKIIEYPAGLTFDHDGGYLSPDTRASYLPENRLLVTYTNTSTTAQNIHLSDIKIARIKESGLSEDLLTTRNWRTLVDIAQINVGFMKYGRNISFSTSPIALSTSGIGLYELNVQSNCRFTLSTSDTGVFFRNIGGSSYSNTIESPSYNDSRYADGGDFRFWVQMQIVTEPDVASRGPISITATEEDRSVSRDMNISQTIISDRIYKLKPDGSNYSNGYWEYTSGRIQHERYSWIKRYSRNSTKIVNVSPFNTSTVYSPGDIVKYNLGSSAWDSSVIYSIGDIVYYQGDWWKNNHRSNLNRDPLNSSWWDCISKYFICLFPFTSTILGDSNTFPMVSSASDPYYDVHTSYWQEISTVDDLQDFESMNTNIHAAPMYIGGSRYECGDMVRVGSASAFASFDPTRHYNIGEKVKVGSSDPYRGYECVGLNTSNDLFGITPEVTDNWQLYWEYFDPYDGYICKKDFIDTNTINPIDIRTNSSWELISDDFINLPRNLRLVGVKAKSLVYLFMDLDTTLDVDLTPENIKNEISDNSSSDEHLEEIKFILDNPSLYKTGLSLCFNRNLSLSTIIDPYSRPDIGGGALEVVRNLYFYVERDSVWVDIEDIDTLISILGSQYNDSYFLDTDKQLTLSDYQDKINYSYLISPGNRRDVFATQECIIGNDLDEIAEQTEKLGIPYLFPYYSSYSDLPGLNCTVRDTNNNFFKTICRISDGGKIRSAVINPVLSSQFRSTVSPVDPDDITTRGITYLGEWEQNRVYKRKDVVCYSNAGQSRVYYYCIDPNNDNDPSVVTNTRLTGINPATDTTGFWECITWTALSPTILTDEDAINTIKGPGYLNLNSSREIGVRGRFNTGTTLFSATQQITNTEPKLGDIIKVGAVYYYCSIWTVIDLPTTQTEVDSLITVLPSDSISSQPLLFIKNQNYFLRKGFSNVLIKNPVLDEYYYLNTKYVFNNIKSNEYIFIPEYSMDYTMVKYFTRKTPSEEIESVVVGDIASRNEANIVYPTTPEFSEEPTLYSIVLEDHYTNHFTGLNLNIPDNLSRTYIPQVQADYEGKLVISNPVSNNFNYWYTNNNSIQWEGGLRTNMTQLVYHLYKEPYAPYVRLFDSTHEITSINLENFYDPNNLSNCTTTFDVVSPHPVMVSTRLFVGNVTDSGGWSGASNNVLSVSTPNWIGNYRYILSNPRIERDGLYHYRLSVYPTTNNNSIGASPVKLGDLYFISRIKKNGTKPTEWVVVEDSNVGIELLKKILRTENLEILELSTIGNISLLPPIEEAIPGLVYRGGANSTLDTNIFNATTSVYTTGTNTIQFTTKLFVAIPYNFVRDDATDSDEKYYYTQEEIDREYGIYQKRVSVIQKSNYEFEITGDRTNDIAFTGETRNYNLVVTGTAWNGEYTVGSVENCTITNDTSTREIVMTVPSRITNYTPRLISDTYYTELKDKIPVSFTVSINSVVRGNMQGAGQSMQLLPGASVSSTYTELESRPFLGTSGLSSNIENTHYKDEYSGLGMFVRSVEKYTYRTRSFIEISGYVYQKTSWINITRSGDISEYISEHNRKYNDNVSGVVSNISRNPLYGLAGINADLLNFNPSTDLPNNADDILCYGYFESFSGSIGTNDTIIEVDNLPKIAQVGAYYTTDHGSTYKKFCPCIEDQNNYANYCDKYFIGVPEWKNAETIEAAYVDLGIATDFVWKEDNTIGLNLTIGYNSTHIYSTIPTASRSNFGTSLWYWRKSDPYSNTTTYNVGNLVVYSNKLWRCKENSVTGVAPSGSSTKWEEVTDTLDTTYNNVSDLPTEIGDGDVLGNYYKIGTSCYDAYKVKCTVKPIYGLVSIAEPPAFTPLTQINNPNYEYYSIDRLPLGVNRRTLTGGVIVVNASDPDYAVQSLPFFIIGATVTTQTKFFRKQISIPTSDLYDSTTNEVYVGKIFKVSEGGTNTYYQLKENPEEWLLPRDYTGSTDSASLGYLGRSEYPGNIILAQDGFGTSNVSFPGKLTIDFNDFSYRIQSFEEKIDLRQKRSTKGIVSNLGESGRDQYRLYLGDSPEKNTITISVDPETTEVSGMIGLFNTSNELTVDSGMFGTFPGFNVVTSPGCNIVSNQVLPRLDGGVTDNFTVTFDPNIGDQDLIHEFEFYTSEDGFNTRVYLRIIQTSDPGEVTILGSSNLYFLSNGLLLSSRNSGNFLDFNSTIDINLNNIEILNDLGEDILDRGDEDNPVSYVNPVSITNGSVRYRAFLKLKPNTTNHAYTNFRIKIGKISGNTVTDRTIVGDGSFYKYTTDQGWSLLGSEYTPTYLERYVTELPTSADYGEVVCVCTSLRGSQGYYSVALFNPRVTSDFDNATGLEYRSAETEDEISDLRSALGIDEAENLDMLATAVSELPERIQQTGLIYKIGNTYYYTYADYITSGFVFGTPQVPIEIGGYEDEQIFHLKVTQLEYNSIGQTTTTNLTDTMFTQGQNYTLSNDRSEAYSGIGEDDTNRIDSGYYNARIIYSSTSMPNFVPYLRTWHEFSEQSDRASTITIKTIIDLEVNYNYSGPIIPESYRKMKNTFTLYIRKD